MCSIKSMSFTISQKVLALEVKSLRYKLYSVRTEKEISLSVNLSFSLCVALPQELCHDNQYLGNRFAKRGGGWGWGRGGGSLAGSSPCMQLSV